MVHVGVDLHKRVSQIAVLTEEGEITQPRLVNEVEHLERFFSQLPPKTPVAIEACGTWWWLVDLLERLGHQPVLSHPKQTKAIVAARLKNDRVDAHRLALLLRGDLLPTVWIPPVELREARELIRHRVQLMWLRGEVRNRVVALLARRNLQPTSGKSCEAMTRADIIVVGGGIAGLAVASHLTRAHRASVLLLDREAVLASHSSGRNAAIFRPLEMRPGVVALAERSRQLFDTLMGASLVEDARRAATMKLLRLWAWLRGGALCRRQTPRPRSNSVSGCGSRTVGSRLGVRGEEAPELDGFEAVRYLAVEGAMNHYSQAMTLAQELGTRPLVAHCHAGLAKLYRRTGKRIESDEHFAAATTMYRDMGMPYWLEKAEAERRDSP